MRSSKRSNSATISRGEMSARFGKSSFTLLKASIWTERSLSGLGIYISPAASHIYGTVQSVVLYAYQARRRSVSFQQCSTPDQSWLRWSTAVESQMKSFSFMVGMSYGTLIAEGSVPAKVKVSWGRAG